MSEISKNTLVLDVEKYERLTHEIELNKSLAENARENMVRYETLLDEEKAKVEALKKEKDDKSLVIERVVEMKRDYRDNIRPVEVSVNYRNFDVVKADIKKELEKEYRNALVEIEDLKKKQTDLISDINYSSERRVKEYRKDYEERLENEKETNKKRVEELQEKIKDLKKELTKLAEGKLDSQIEASRKDLIEKLEDRIKQLERPRKYSFLSNLIYKWAKKFSDRFNDELSLVENKAYTSGIKNGNGDAILYKNLIERLPSDTIRSRTSYGWYC